MRRKKDLDTAWAAGLFEGEGCISRTEPTDSRPRWCLNLVSSDRDVLVSCGFFWNELSPPQPLHEIYQLHYKKQWIWRITKRAEVESLLKILIPYFGKRRSVKAHEALLEIAEMGPAIVGFRGHRKVHDLGKAHEFVEKP